MMRIVEFNSLDKAEKANFVSQMELCDWDAGRYLAWMLKSEKLQECCGEYADAYFAVEGDTLCSFCTFADFDEIESETMKPWMGFVYTFPAFRGHRFSGVLADYTAKKASDMGFKKLYVSSEEKGLYEKYGFTFIETMHSIHGYDTGVFVRELKE